GGLPYNRLLINELNKKQKRAVVEVFAPLLTPAIMKYLIRMVLNVPKNKVTITNEELGSPEWINGVREQNDEAYDAALECLPSLRKRREELADAEVDDPCPDCGLSLAANWNDSMGICMACGYGNESRKYD
ncbi:hypothetical protein VNI00_018567, partial [Paramarasmius palmivorus]